MRYFVVHLYPASTVYCIDAAVLPHEYAQTFHFTLDLGNPKVNSFQFVTPKIDLDGLSSVIHFRRTIDSPNVKVTLAPVCISSEPMYLQASIKLLGVSRKEDITSKSITLSKHLVDKTRCAPILVSQLDYYDMAENYTQNGNATFEIELAVNRVHPNSRPIAFGVVGRKFRFELKNANLNSTSFKRIYIAPAFTVRGITWSLYAEKKDKYLGIYLKASENDLDTWFYKADATITLLSFKKEVDPIKYTFTHTYSIVSPIHGNQELISLSDLLDTNKQYVFNNSLSLLVDIHVE